jgi:hypothetical protein
LGAEKLLREIVAMMDEDPELARRISREVLVMSRKYPTLEENIRFIVQDLGAEKLLRGIVEELGREKVEQLLREMDEEQKRKRTDGRRRSRRQGR